MLEAEGDKSSHSSPEKKARVEGEVSDEVTESKLKHSMCKKMILSDESSLKEMIIKKWLVRILETSVTIIV